MLNSYSTAKKYIRCNLFLRGPICHKQQTQQVKYFNWQPNAIGSIKKNFFQNFFDSDQTKHCAFHTNKFSYFEFTDQLHHCKFYWIFVRHKNYRYQKVIKSAVIESAIIYLLFGKPAMISFTYIFQKLLNYYLFN